MTVFECVLSFVVLGLVAVAGNEVGGRIAPWVGKNPNRFWGLIGGVLVVLATVAYIRVTSQWEGGIR
jgi:hypothetical protein